LGGGCGDEAGDCDGRTGGAAESRRGCLTGNGALDAESRRVRVDSCDIIGSALCTPSECE